MKRKEIALLILIFLSIIVASYIFPSIIFGYTLARMTYPIKRRLEQKMGNILSSAVVSAIPAVIAVLILVVIMNKIIEATYYIATIKIPKIPISYELVASYWKDIINTLGKFSYVLLVIISSFILQYYFLVEYERVREIEKGIDNLIGIGVFDTVNKVIDGVIIGQVLTSLTQALIAFPLYLAANAPYPLLLTVLQFFTSMIPVFGAAAVYIPVSLYLIYTGNISGGVLLLLGGIFVISVIDNIVKPYFMRPFIGAHPAIIYVSIIGGIGIFGLPGILYGPIIMCTTCQLLKEYLEKSKLK